MTVEQAEELNELKMEAAGKRVAAKGGGVKVPLNDVESSAKAATKQQNMVEQGGIKRERGSGTPAAKKNKRRESGLLADIVEEGVFTSPSPSKKKAPGKRGRPRKNSMSTAPLPSPVQTESLQPAEEHKVDQSPTESIYKTRTQSEPADSPKASVSNVPKSPDGSQAATESSSSLSFLSRSPSLDGQAASGSGPKEADVTTFPSNQPEECSAPAGSPVGEETSQLDQSALDSENFSLVSLDSLRSQQEIMGRILREEREANAAAAAAAASQTHATNPAPTSCAPPSVGQVSLQDIDMPDAPATSPSPSQHTADIWQEEADRSLEDSMQGSRHHDQAQKSFSQRENSAAPSSQPRRIVPFHKAAESPAASPFQSLSDLLGFDNRPLRSKLPFSWRRQSGSSTLLYSDEAEEDIPGVSPFPSQRLMAQRDLEKYRNSQRAVKSLGDLSTAGPADNSKKDVPFLSVFRKWGRKSEDGCNASEGEKMKGSVEQIIRGNDNMDERSRPLNMSEAMRFQHEDQLRSPLRGILSSPARGRTPSPSKSVHFAQGEDLTSVLDFEVQSPEESQISPSGNYGGRAESPVNSYDETEETHDERSKGVPSRRPLQLQRRRESVEEEDASRREQARLFNSILKIRDAHMSKEKSGSETFLGTEDSRQSSKQSTKENSRPGNVAETNESDDDTPLRIANMIANRRGTRKDLDAGQSQIAQSAPDTWAPVKRGLDATSAAPAAKKRSREVDGDAAKDIEYDEYGNSALLRPQKRPRPLFAEVTPQRDSLELSTVPKKSIRTFQKFAPTSQRQARRRLGEGILCRFWSWLSSLLTQLVQRGIETCLSNRVSQPKGSITAESLRDRQPDNLYSHAPVWTMNHDILLEHYRAHSSCLDPACVPPLSSILAGTASPGPTTTTSRAPKPVRKYTFTPPSGPSLPSTYFTTELPQALTRYIGVQFSGAFGPSAPETQDTRVGAAGLPATRKRDDVSAHFRNKWLHMTFNEGHARVAYAFAREVGERGLPVVNRGDGSRGNEHALRDGEGRVVRVREEWMDNEDAVAVLMAKVGFCELGEYVRRKEEMMG